MCEYEDFRLRINPDLVEEGHWAVVVRKAPIEALVGKHATVAPVLSKQAIRQLRSREGWPNVASLKQIGEAVWASVLQGDVGAAFEASLQYAGQMKKCLRVVLVIQGQENETANGEFARLSELPVEALYTDEHQFIATDRRTPISRSFQDEPDREPERIALPLRVLVLVAAPVDKPEANAEEEEAALRAVVDEIDPASSVLDVEVVQQTTRDDLARLLSKRYDILHFIGHGGFDIVGDDPTPRAHVSLVRRDGTGRSDNVDADTLANALRNSQVRLVVMTACSTAAPTPDSEPYGISAFEGVAQRLVTGISGVTAAVAMQFDLESEAAVRFTRTFYSQLLQPDVSLDEAVTLARVELANQLDAGHRAWVTPTVFWRCKSAQVFLTDLSRSELDPEKAAELQAVDTALSIVRRHIDRIDSEPATLRPLLADYLESLRGELRELELERGRLLGENLRAEGTAAGAGAEIRLGLWLRTRATGPISMLDVELRYPSDALTIVGTEPGAETPDYAPALAPLAAGRVRLIIPDVSAGAAWTPGEREIGAVRLKVADGLKPRILDLGLVSPTITRGGEQVRLRPVDGVVFVD